MSKSIISNRRECIICGRTWGLHKHHVFPGRNRKISEREGCWVYLCERHHNMSNVGVHNNKELDLKLKKQCQLKWEEKSGTREDFIRAFGRNYI